MKTVAIVTPTYRPNLTSGDLTSIKQLKRYLNRYDKYYVIPRKINDKEFKSKNLGLKNLKIIKLPNKFFSSIAGYNKMLLSKDFYELFADYKYILIYQPDAIVFSDQLSKWINKGYDYVGAPWHRSIVGSLSHKKGFPASGGNGGFCLRNIQKTIKVLEIVDKLATRTSRNMKIRKLWFIVALLTGKSHKIWLNAPAVDYPFNEDGFWSLEAPKYLKGYKVPPFNTAAQFGFEKLPRKYFALNKNRIPFGAHAWERYDKEFWMKYIN